MKKALLAATVVLASLSFNSCTKLYNCTCVSEVTDTLTKVSRSQTDVYKQRETSKKLADSKCQQNATPKGYYIGNDKHVVTCTLEQVKAK